MTASHPGGAGAVLIVAAAGTLTELERALRRARIAVERFDATRFELCLSASRKRNLGRPTWDGVVVSTPRVLELFLGPVLGRPTQGQPAPRAYVAGEPTAVGAARLGYVVVRPTGDPGWAGIANAVPAGRRLHLLNARSDAAGPTLTRLIRARGHTVRDVVAIRSVVASRMPLAARRAAKNARGIVVTSLAGLRSLRRHLGPAEFRAVADHAPFRVLDQRILAAARRAGVRRVGLLVPGPRQAFDPAAVPSLFDGGRGAVRRRTGR
jgi:uroporphyrinogen-III synthase